MLMGEIVCEAIGYIREYIFRQREQFSAKALGADGANLRELGERHFTVVLNRNVVEISRTLSRQWKDDDAFRADSFYYEVVAKSNQCCADPIVHLLLVFVSRCFETKGYRPVDRLQETLNLTNTSESTVVHMEVHRLASVRCLTEKRNRAAIPF